MDESELVTLLSLEGLRLLDELPPYDTAADVVHTVSALRAAGHSPALVAAVLNQSKLRRRAAPKFGEFAGPDAVHPGGAGAGDPARGGRRARRTVPAAGLTRIADLGCGIGGDALVMAALDLRSLRSSATR